MNKNNLKKQASGFALISTMLIMGLLLVIAISMLSLATIELRSSDKQSTASEAQANARMALMIAIGELQMTMGPDTRISARAELLAKDSREDNPTISPNTPKAWWVGASSSDPTQSIDTSNGNKVVWLISGLDASRTPSEQLASPPFADPVTMYGDNTIDTAGLTGGQPIEAGKVSITNPTSKRPGKFAWFIDDNGMKAQLAASNPLVKNDLATPYGGGVIPGSHDVGELDGMAELAGRTPEELNKMLSTNDLPFLGASRQIVSQKRMSYTTTSRGVLSNTKDGGLKKDLTVVYENEDAFAAIWPTSYDDASAEYDPSYIVMDPDKFAASSDLKANGYIHWEMFKDYYNSKKYIQTDSTGMEFMEITLFSHGAVKGLYSKIKKWETGGANAHYPSALGRVGPHNIGNNSDTHPEFKKMPYGDYHTIVDANNFTGDGGPYAHHLYKHSPITPVLMRMQVNAWLETVEKDDPFTPEPDEVTYIRTKGQMLFNQYNPYNVGLRVVRPGENWGPNMPHFPNMNLGNNGMTVETRNHLDIPRQGIMKPQNTGYHFKAIKNKYLYVNKVTLGPGRSHVYAFGEDIPYDAEKGEYVSAFSDNVKDVVNNAVYKDYRLVADSPGTFEAIVYSPIITHGTTSGGGGRGGTVNYKLAQAFWSPFSHTGHGKRVFKVDNVGIDDLNENIMASFSFHLRTSSEPSSGSGPAIRPLIDSNMRAMLNNARWDSPLDLPVLAAYSMENGGEANEQIMQMYIPDPDDGKGYAYWGAGRDAVDGHHRVVLFDIPREDLVSLGQLQHANVGRFGYEPTYIVGNSYANLRIPQGQWKDSITDTFSTSASVTQNGDSIAGEFNLYDASYLVNEVLWDSAIFTTIPQVNDDYGTVTESKATEEDYESLRKGDTFLANPRFLPYEPSGSRFNLATLQENTDAYHHNAGHVMVDGAFNVNSTSIDAWEAFLSGTKGLPYQKFDESGVVTGFEKDADGVRFPRLTATFGGPMETDSIDKNFWKGFRNLKNTETDPEIRELASAIVAEIKDRGPFLTMGEFVNRKLESGPLGQRGALQAALDNTVNKDIDGNFSGNTNVSSITPTVAIPENSKQGAGFPGHLQQGDILQALSPFMTVRSDTFTIRAYGETLSPDGNTVLAKAWCEATVQRFPDPVPSAAGGDALAELANPTSPFGRAFRIISFRWLNRDEI